MNRRWGLPTAFGTLGVLLYAGTKSCAPTPDPFLSIRPHVASEHFSQVAGYRGQTLLVKGMAEYRLKELLLASFHRDYPNVDWQTTGNQPPNFVLILTPNRQVIITPLQRNGPVESQVAEVYYSSPAPWIQNALDHLKMWF